MKNIKFGFFLKPLSLYEIISLSLIVFIEILIYYFKYIQIHLEIIKIMGSIVFMALWWVPISTPLSEKFRNIYFFLLWLAICTLWLTVQEDFTSSILPFLIFIFLQITRFIFKWIYKKEPIPLLITKSINHRYSKLENRKSDQNDVCYSLIIFVIAGFLSIVVFL
ncbi:hypothetical protein [Chryseobacterium polytrichastri]|uniref:Uncharacterized protein n=1 Tax=Chryseobacterium polytrichastri TaxID=1302687 RepID=A0A1M7BNP6_9FLAO|nr:hypothetical protein [Chryseobacterium polytrichastri]SHL56189.1 hypothetical protein SAMN05444267_102018 [Chryseobacterium polytrichastri]